MLLSSSLRCIVLIRLLNSYRKSLRTSLNLFNAPSTFDTTTKTYHSLRISTKPNALNNLYKAGKSSRIGYRGLSALLGVVTLATFGIDRFLLETAGQPLEDIFMYVLYAVLLVVGIGAFYASANGKDIRTTVLLSLGPVGGLLVYLIGYHLVLPTSTDSPKWLIFLAFTVGLLAIGTIAHLCGRLVQRGSVEILSR